MQYLLYVSQNLFGSRQEQLTRIGEMKEEVSAAIGRVEAAFRISQTDQDTIERLKADIGNRKDSFRLCNRII